MEADERLRQPTDGYWTDEDHYPLLVEVLQRILQDTEAGETPVEWVEITTLASGEATFKYRQPRAQEHVGGYLGPE